MPSVSNPVEAALTPAAYDLLVQLFARYYALLELRPSESCLCRRWAGY